MKTNTGRVIEPAATCRLPTSEGRGLLPFIRMAGWLALGCSDARAGNTSVLLGSSLQSLNICPPRALVMMMMRSICFCLVLRSRGRVSKIDQTSFTCLEISIKLRNTSCG